ncbi:DUF2591 domain-containing protein [Citrobacter freundii]|uniref:DUF2591 domain-containing protein n=1 Tax=Citrobacter freundii TaxID=546 RepID=UPI00383AB750
MKNYSEMTDFEINCLVAEATGHRPLISQYGWKGSQEGDYTAVVAIGPNGAGTFDWCNSPGCAWEIILKSRISILWIESTGIWCANAGGLVEANYWGWDECPEVYFENKNPLRAAMIVFLLMQEKKREKTV